MQNLGKMAMFTYMFKHDGQIKKERKKERKKEKNMNQKKCAFGVCLPNLKIRAKGLF